jgi:transcriptional regulator with XRE-family HTH domain
MTSLKARRWFLREWRLQRGLTQEELAERTGSTMIKADVSRLETGRRRWNVDQLWILAKALDVEPWWLVAIDPSDSHSDLAMIEAIRSVPNAKRADALRVLKALSS